MIKPKQCSASADGEQLCGICLVDYIPAGAENAVPMKELALAMGIDERTLKHLVLKAREHGCPICSEQDKPHNGYYMPKTKDEAIRYYRIQRARIRSAEKALKAVGGFIGEDLTDE